MTSPSKILIIQLRQLGDILLTTPCVSAARHLWPNAQIDFLSHRMGKLVLENNPNLSNLLSYDEKFPVGESLRLLKELKKQSYDLVFDFMNNPRSLLFSLATFCSDRRTYHSSRSFAYSRVVPRSLPGEYIVASKLRVFENEILNAENFPLVLPWAESDLPNWENFSQRIPQWETQAPRIVMSPTHRREARRWPMRRFAQLADFLVQRYAATIVWVWGPGEESIATECHKLCEERTYVAPPTTFRQMAALIAHSDYFISTSNGPSHVAVAVRTPSFQIHGPTSLQNWCLVNSTHTGIDSADGNLENLRFDPVRIAVQDHIEKIKFRSRGHYKNWQMALNVCDRSQTSHPE